MTIDPRGLTVKEWCDYMVGELAHFGQIPILLDPDEWRSWGQALTLFPGIAAYNPPNPQSFSDWESWAMRFNQSLPL